MNSVDASIAQHYGRGELETALLEGLRRMGLDGEAPLAAEDLHGLDEFHIGGGEATAGLVARMGLQPGMTVLDIGSGLGGPARHMARHNGVTVTGIDLTPEYVALATSLTARAGLAESVTFHQGSAAALPLGPGRFDAATLMHVGMNLPDKGAVFASVHAALRPGGAFAVYDVMKTGEGDLAYPVPWATTPASSFLAGPREYRDALEGAGFVIEHEEDRREFALDFFRRLRARQQAAGGPPPVGLHLVMGSDAPTKIGNMLANIQEGLIAPVEMLCRRP